ncbi:chromosome condensation regulator RCC1 [Histomonas meleagridis]|uniref:chromosome condensation regulator RCC1 n=1 Tax=Histomonas meleagridis TaxID=135588 RepID=UPI00355A3F06|nr:chromosome condensation regulator RCC1 [Histomonas meleagridis]KAH0805984.1 chromosome condensation regulator RCC1 [Histomonas meleagridis]
MAFYQRNPYVVDVNGIIYNLIPNEQVNVEINGLVRTIVGSSNRLFAITFDKSCYLIVEDSAIKLAENCKCVGATEENVFVSTNDGLFEVQDFDLKRIDFDKKIVSISCSETDAYFIDSDGLLYNFYNNKFIRVYGLPPIESVSVGEQHNAAIGRNKKLYTWGFNPSGQLGTRNDKSTNNPICILEDVSMVAVTNQATYVLKG